LRRFVLQFFLPACFLLPGCSLLAPKINKTPPTLFDMEEPLALYEEPADEQERRELPSGGFTGVLVTDARQSLEDLGEAPEGVLVDRIVENSPGDFAGLAKGDLIVEANGQPMQYASAWRALEFDGQPGSKIAVVYDRAGAERTALVEVEARAHPANRVAAERFREEDRTGIVVRTATEVEARAAGLGPGGGAVIVGMARTSPWRSVGLRFGDLIVAADDKPIEHPNALLQVIRAAPAKSKVKIAYFRDGQRAEIEAPVSRRAQEQQIVDVPLLYYYEKDRNRVVFWVFFAIYKHTRTEAARETRILWLIKLRSGDSDRLEEVKE